MLSASKYLKMRQEHLNLQSIHSTVPKTPAASAGGRIEAKNQARKETIVNVHMALMPTKHMPHHLRIRIPLSVQALDLMSKNFEERIFSPFAHCARKELLVIPSLSRSVNFVKGLAAARSDRSLG